MYIYYKIKKMKIKLSEVKHFQKIAGLLNEDELGLGEATTQTSPLDFNKLKAIIKLAVEQEKFDEESVPHYLQSIKTIEKIIKGGEENFGKYFDELEELGSDDYRLENYGPKNKSLDKFSDVMNYGPSAYEYEWENLLEWWNDFVNVVNNYK